VLFVAAAVILTADHRDRVEAYQAAAAQHRDALAGARVYSQLRLESDRPPAALSVLCQGVDRALPSSSAYSLTEPPTQSGAGASRNPLLVVFPSLDLAIVVQVVMSLPALLFAYDTVSGERARGTLALTLANGLPRSTLLLGKVLGGMAVLGLLLAVGMGSSTLVIASSPVVRLGPAEWSAAAFIFAASAAYLGVVFLIGMVLSIVTARPGTSLIAGLFAWVVLVLLAPQAASAVAAAASPLPSSREQAAAEERATSSFWS
jgi:ABC-2 type transport system permease protein